MNSKLVNILDKHDDFDPRAFLDGRCEISYSLYDDLYCLWVEDMPYGTAKARDGDPYQWIDERLFEELDGLV
jgi:hypothetical protein